MQVVQDVRLQGGQVVELVVLVRRGVAAVGGGVEERVVVRRRVLGQGRLVGRQQRAQGVVVVGVVAAVVVVVVVVAAVGGPGGGGGGGPGPQRTAGALRGVSAADAAAGAVLGVVRVWAVPPTSAVRLVLVVGLLLTRTGSRSRRIRPVLAAVVGGRAQVPPTTTSTTTSTAVAPPLGGGDVEVAVPGCGARTRGVPETVHHVVQLVPRVAQRPPAAVAAVVGRFRRRPHPSQRPAVPVPVPASVPTPVVGRAVV